MFQDSQEFFKGDIYDYLSQEDIYERYLGYSPDVTKSYSSPFSEDKTPSFRFYYGGNKLLYKDFSTGLHGDAVQLVVVLNNCNSYREAVQLIANNFNVIAKAPTIQRVFKEKEEKKIEVELFKKAPDSFFKYWSRFGITPNILQYFDIKPAECVWLNKRLIKTYKPDDIIIRYKINGRYKIYSPMNKQYKWLSNTKATDIFAIDKIPKTGKLLVISKAMKDIMVWAVIGTPSIAMLSEMVLVPKDIMQDLKTRYKKIIVFLDNDDAGKEASKKYYQEYQLDTYLLPDNCGAKDIGEYVESNSINELKLLLKTLKPQCYV